MSTEPSPTRRPIAPVRVSSVALLGVVAAIAVPAGATDVVLSGSLDSQHTTQAISQPGPISKVVVIDGDSSVHITGDSTRSGVSGKADLTWRGFGGSDHARVSQQFANGVLTLTKDCGGGDCSADIDIQVPPTVSVQVTTSEAGITVANVSGTVEANTSDAGITATGLGAGDATFHTSNASIHASFAGGPKNISAVTSNAPVTITTDGRTSYYDDVQTSNAGTNTENNPDRHSYNTVYVRTSNAPVTIK